MSNSIASQREDQQGSVGFPQVLVWEHDHMERCQSELQPLILGADHGGSGVLCLESENHRCHLAEFTSTLPRVYQLCSKHAERCSRTKLIWQYFKDCIREDC